ncbi:MAG: hypothetical protein ACI4OZ_08965 [Akkermansia sp.]
MKRFFSIASALCAAATLLTSCQKEEESTLKLAQELTEELQSVVNKSQADASAERVKVLYERFINSLNRPMTGDGSALYKSCGNPETDPRSEEFAKALQALAKEIGRVRASKPVPSYDQPVDDQILYTAVEKHRHLTQPERPRKNYGEASAEEIEVVQQHSDLAGGIADENKQRWMNNTLYGSTDSDGEEFKELTMFDECYGSTAMQEALAYKTTPSKQELFSAPEAPAAPEKKEAQPEPEPETAEAPALTGLDSGSSSSDDEEDSGDSDSGSDDDSSDTSDTDTDTDIDTGDSSDDSGDDSTDSSDSSDSSDTSDSSSDSSDSSTDTDDIGLDSGSDDSSDSGTDSGSDDSSSDDSSSDSGSDDSGSSEDDDELDLGI